MDHRTTQELAAMLRTARRHMLRDSYPPGLLKGFHQWADGKPCEGAFLVQGEDSFRTWLVLIDWKRNGAYYVVLFPENRFGPIYEVHKMRSGGPDPSLEWTYVPRKRDGKNAQRRAYFLATYGTVTAKLTLPKTDAGIDDFVDLHTLCDLNLLMIDSRYRIRISKVLRHSEDKDYDGKVLKVLPDRSEDQPSANALEQRLRAFDLEG